MTENERVVAALLVLDDQVLLGHRHPGRVHFPDCWDAIGGHVESGETDVEALRRELDEELVISVDVGDRSADAYLVGLGYDLRLWIIHQWRGEIRNLAPEDHDDLGWFRLAQLSRLNFADPRLAQTIVAALGE